MAPTPLSTFTTSPPHLEYANLTFPAPHIALVTLSRPKDLNCINSQGHLELHSVFEWLDNEPSLRVGIVTGTGRAFCAGADLKEWLNRTSGSSATSTMPSSGFGGLSRRTGLKPIIAAVNGLCLGGGFEMAINTDLIVSSPSAKFALPEVKRGVIAFAGALPRLVRTVGKQRAMEMALTGRMVTAAEGEKWGFVNKIVGEGEDVVAAAVEIAKSIAENSPDAVVVSREGIKMGWEGLGADEAGRVLAEGWGRRVTQGENIKEGLKAFVEKRKPVWRDAKL